MKEIQVQLDGDQKELILREGQAPKLREFSGYQISASVASVIDYYKKRKGNPITTLNSYLAINKNKAEVELVINDTVTAERISITGQLTPNKDFVDLGINNNKLFSETELESALRKRPHLFNDVDTYNKFMSSLRNFSSDVRVAFSKSDNRAGSASANASVDVKTDGLEKTVQLKISPWADAPAQTFNINIYVTSDGGFAKFYLESVDLMLMQEQIKEEAFSNIEKELAALPILFV